MFKIAIRVDGGEGIGMGHIMRCLSLATEFISNGVSVYFISKTNMRMEQILNSGFKICYIRGNTLEEEFFEIINVIKNDPVNMLIVDNYNVNKVYFENLKKKSKSILMYIDDKNQGAYPVDIILNGNIGANKVEYFGYKENVKLLLGCRYNLIKKEYIESNDKKIKKEVKNIMLTTGGTDPHNCTMNFIKMLVKNGNSRKLNINVVLGCSFKNKENIKAVARKYNNIFIYENLTSLKEIMLNSDIAISAGGTTLYELAACGTPTLGFVMVDNQERNIKLMKENGIIKSLGWYNKVSYKVLTQNIEDLTCNYEERKMLSKNMKNLIDCKGTKRVVDEVLNYVVEDSVKQVVKV